MRVTVSGRSMYPYLKKGDVVIIESADINNLDTGDIIVFSSSKNLVAHRLIKKVRTAGTLQIKCKGDFCRKYDPEVSEGDFVGRVTSYERNSKAVNLNTPYRKKIDYILAVISACTATLFTFAKKVRNIF